MARKSFNPGKGGENPLQRQGGKEGNPHIDLFQKGTQTSPRRKRGRSRGKEKGEQKMSFSLKGKQVDLKTLGAGSM